jgi:glyoxylase-like metal-dependent hydrolase (beta-lactamase superfamily II)
MKFRHLLAVCGLAATALMTADLMAQTAPPPPVREIVKIAGEVYRFRNNFHYTVFAVTPAGVIATDPINADAATWLKNELKTRFNQTVKYLIYSHDHADHISGGQVFADTATVVAHENAKSVIVGERRPTAIPQVTFSDKMAIELGGTTVELHYTGRNHSDNSIVLRFPAEKIAFAVDFIPVKSMAFRDLPDVYMPDWIDSIKRVEAMEFDIFAPGQGPLGTKEDVRNFRTYLTELREEVLALARQGKSADEVKQAVKMAKYSAWAGYEQMQQLNVEGMYRLVQANRRGN